VSRRISQIATSHAAFARHPRARPLELDISRLPLPLLPLRPDDPLPILKMALSMDSQSSVSFPLAIQATGLLTFAPVGLTVPLNTPAFRDLCGYAERSLLLDIRVTCSPNSHAENGRVLRRWIRRERTAFMQSPVPKSEGPGPPAHAPMIKLRMGHTHFSGGS